MSFSSSEQNKLIKAASILTAVLLCLGGFFIFTSCGADKDAQSSTGAPSGDGYSLLTYTGASVPTPSVSAKAAVLIEAKSGEVIWSRSPDDKLPMASTTKIMTALVAIENGDITKTVEVAREAVGIEGSSIYLYESERLTLEDLLYAMLLESANDAATAIAVEIGGDVESFSQMMNDKAAQLGLESTHFSNPHGLDDEEHFTTARELAVIARAAMQNDTFRQIVSTYKKTIPLNETEGVRLLINHNKLLKRYDGACGIKTGYTKKSGRCLVSAAERDGVELIAVTLNAPDDWRDHAEMLDYGFSLYESRVLCGEREFCRTVSVIGGQSDTVTVQNATEVKVILPRNAGEVKCTVELPQFVFADVRRGDTVGRLVYSVGETVIAECDIIATGSVERVQYKKGLFALLFG